MKNLLLPLLLITLSATAQNQSSGKRQDGMGLHLQPDTTVTLKISEFRKLWEITQRLQRPVMNDAIRLRINMDLLAIHYTVIIDSIKKEKGGK